MPSALLPLSSLIIIWHRSPSSFIAIAVLSPSLLVVVAGFLKPTTYHFFSSRSSSNCIHVASSLPLLAISLVPPSPMGEHVAVPSDDAASPPSLSLFLFTVDPISPYPRQAPVLTSFISPFSLLASPSFAPPAIATMAIFSTDGLPCILSSSIGSLLPLELDRCLPPLWCYCGLPCHR